MWIGCNPSTADEIQLDPTLRRIKTFSQAFGYNAFIMTNIFAFRSTNPRVLEDVDEPVGVENNVHLVRCAEMVGTHAIFAAWGAMGIHKGRGNEVKKLLTEAGYSLQCIRKLNGEQPGHPLYVAGDVRPMSFATRVFRNTYQGERLEE